MIIHFLSMWKPLLDPYLGRSWICYWQPIQMLLVIHRMSLGWATISLLSSKLIWSLLDPSSLHIRCIYITKDNKEVTLLVLLDLTAAFDTIEHSILLNILQQDFGVAGTALNWFYSFLSGRKQRILVDDKTSDDFNLNCAVPQGSCMGPVLFTLYSLRLSAPPLCSWLRWRHSDLPLLSTLFYSFRN